MHSFTEISLSKTLDYIMIGEVSFTWITNGLSKAIEKYETPNYFSVLVQNSGLLFPKESIILHILLCKLPSGSRSAISQSFQFNL